MRKPRDENESAGQIVPLAKARAVAKPKPMAWRAFNRFVDSCDALCRYREKLSRAFSETTPTMTIARLEGDAEYCRDLVARCKAGLARFDDPANYEPDDDDDEFVVLSHDHIAKRVTVMLASFPNANPTDPDGYVKMLIEHIGGTNVCQLSLESALREIVDTHKFAPAIAEVLSVIERHIAIWRERQHAIRETEDRRLAAIEKLIECQCKQEQDQRERELAQAVNAVRNAMQSTRKLAQQIEDKKLTIELEKEALAKLQDALVAAEQRESELSRKLRSLHLTEDERAEVAAAELEGLDCAELDLDTTVH
jgi:hypothetical protein